MFDSESGIQINEKKVTLKNPHPCGSSEFTVVQMGIEVVLKCEKCGSFVRLEKDRFKRSVK